MSHKLSNVNGRISHMMATERSKYYLDQSEWAICTYTYCKRFVCSERINRYWNQGISRDRSIHRLYFIWIRHLERLFIWIISKSLCAIQFIVACDIFLFFKNCNLFQKYQYLLWTIDLIESRIWNICCYWVWALFCWLVSCMCYFIHCCSECAMCIDSGALEHSRNAHQFKLESNWIFLCFFFYLKRN